MKSSIFILLLFFMVVTGFIFFSATPVNNTGSDINIPCFVYHRFGDSRYPSTNISVEDFEKHMKYLSDNHFNVVTLGRALEMINKNETVPEKTVVINIDDGYKSFLTNGMPVLRKYGFKATLFVNTNASGSDLLTWDEIEQLTDEDIEIGSHGHSHHYFLNEENPGETLKAFSRDLEQSGKIFKEKLGYRPELFAYPYGEFNNAMKDEVKRQGFKAAAAQNSGVISKYSDPYALPRFPSAGSYADFNKFVEKSKMRALPVVPGGNPDHTRWKNNPPELKLKLLAPDAIRDGSLKCYIAGTSECSLDYDETTQTITVKADRPLPSRRTLYTVTASSSGKTLHWYWYSFLWINPDKK